MKPKSYNILSEPPFPFYMGDYMGEQLTTKVKGHDKVNVKLITQDFKGSNNVWVTLDFIARNALQALNLLFRIFY
jgi:hypothetical protein